MLGLFSHSEEGSFHLWVQAHYGGEAVGAKGVEEGKHLACGPRSALTRDLEWRLSWERSEEVGRGS